MLAAAARARRAGLPRVPCHDADVTARDGAESTGREDLTPIAEVARAHGERLVRVPGVVGVALCGPLARGGADADADVDLAIYYRRPFDLERLRSVAANVAGRPVDLAPPGSRGAWADGGVALDVHVGGRPLRVDWVLRDLDRVRHERERARLGRVELLPSWSHPLGFSSAAYVGELATSVVVADPGGELVRLRRECAQMPEALADAMVDWLGEARYSLVAAERAAAQGDVAFVALALSRSVVLAAYALHGAARAWVLGERGAVSAAGALPVAPEGFRERGHGLLATLGSTPDSLGRSVARVRLLVGDVERACELARG